MVLLNVLKSKNFLLAIIIFFAVGLRLVNLSAESFRADELLSLDIVLYYQNQPISEMVDYINTIEVHPPFYYILLKYWILIFGGGEFAVKFLSVLFGAGTIILVYYIAKRWFKDENIALYSAFFTAILPMQIEFSQEARPYIIFSFFILLSGFWLIRYLESGEQRYALLYIISSLFGLYIHYSFALFLIPLVLYWPLHYLIFEKSLSISEIKKWFIAHSAIALGFWPQLDSFLYKAFFLRRYELYDLSSAVYAGNSKDITFFESVVNQLIWTTSHVSFKQIEILAVFIFKIALIGSLLYLIIKHKERLSAALVKYGRFLLFCAWMAFAPMILFLFSPYSEGYRRTYESHLLASSIFIIFIISFLIAQLDRKQQFFLASLFFISLVSYTANVLGNDSYWDPDHRLKEVAGVINENYQPGDIVIHQYTYGRTDVNHYLRPELSALTLIPYHLYDWQLDFFATRETLGLLENETMMRERILKDKSTKEEQDKKMRYIMKQYRPQRVWTTFLNDDLNLQMWMMGNGWKKGIGSAEPLMPVQLYIKDTGEAEK
ncbi:hypothetical protein COT99_03990 [Candidatus Falkowbacteria bacterium CG10_big_fil_rev_8_21_14_0_10_43_10]|uniref:Glycosyltransferase RgtA/B/C/D-like domain-containing protein n=1 Tax=Candidatus Falkowbacteria bacterium CG10_big_fil_rev_8_21_14_0_10_43_10 TaxID=1974567 RepID=A0A2H0V1D1_9BACT|nr:MAG: hypothetical protein COT99_03990 [Candidatus Falkowbacteria bacterium CG10_big_fil_rev_8_21_14_0_10_43_10]